MLMMGDIETALTAHKATTIDLVDADMKEARENLISVCRDWERGKKTTLLPIVAVRARYFLEHLVEPKQPESGNSEKPNDHAEWSEEQQEQLKVDLEKELDRYLRGEFQQTAGGNFNNYIQVARHFYELGRARKEDEK